MDDELQRQAVTSGEMPGLIAAYRRAVRGADQLRTDLIAAGLNPDDLTVVAGLGEHGEPVVHVTAFPVLAVALSALLADAAGPLPRLWPRRPYRGDPNVA